MGLGDALLQISAATNGAGALADYQKTVAANALLQQQTQAAQMENQTNQSALSALADMRQKGVTNPQQIMNSLASYSPAYAEKAAQYQAQNPLAALLQGSGAQGGASGTPQPLANLTGDDLLKALPPAIASQIKGIATGTQQLPQGMGGASNRQALLQLVNQYDPSFDAVNYNSRAATRKDFTSGKPAQNITALNTAIGHISTLQDAANELGNTDYPTVNGVVNWARNLTGSDKVKNFDTAKTAVADELERVFRGAGGSVSGINEWKKNMDAASSPEQFKGVMNQMVELLNSRLDSIGQQYNQGMGTTKQGVELLSPKAQKAYQAITGSPPEKTEVTGSLAADNAASEASSVGNIKDGATATNPQTGERIIFQNGKWQALK